MLFSKAQQAAMNLVANVLSEVKTQQEKYKSMGDVGGYDEQTVTYVLSDGMAIQVKVEAQTVKVVSE